MIAPLSRLSKTAHSRIHLGIIQCYAYNTARRTPAAVAMLRPLAVAVLACAIVAAAAAADAAAAEELTFLGRHLSQEVVTCEPGVVDCASPDAGEEETCAPYNGYYTLPGDLKWVLGLSATVAAIMSFFIGANGVYIARGAATLGQSGLYGRWRCRRPPQSTRAEHASSRTPYPL